jgi:hypothetical protein|tara:strand:- start:205 stop:753 length:549 start_codon:yes stop_codon:yes gene_type:complete
VINKKRGNNKRPLTFENLEPRTPLAGLTLITHGFQLGDDPNLPRWVNSMAEETRKAIATSYGHSERYEDIASFNLELIENNSNQIQVSDWDYSNYQHNSELNDYNLSDSFNAEAIITLDWSSIAAVNETSTITVARTVSDYLLNSNWNLGKQLLSSGIHLIGHSRGASLVSALAENLGKEGI